MVHRLKFAAVMYMSILCVAAWMGCSRAPAASVVPNASTEQHTLGSVLLPTWCDAGQVLGGTGQSTPISCQPYGNAANPTALPFFSPVTVMEQIAADSNNGQTFHGSNNAGASTGYTNGTAFVVTQSGHTARGVRFYWAGDPTYETSTTVKCELWDFHSGTSVATAATVAVGRNAEYTCTYGAPYTLTAGRIYVASIVDIGPCTPSGCVLGSTYLNAVSSANNVCANLIGGGTQAIQAGPWVEFVPSVAHGYSSSGSTSCGIGMQSGSTGDLIPSGCSNSCTPIEPVLQ